MPPRRRLLTPDDPSSGDEATPHSPVLPPRVRVRSLMAAATGSPVVQRAQGKETKVALPAKPTRSQRQKPIVEVPTLQAVLRKRKTSGPGTASQPTSTRKRQKAIAVVEDHDDAPSTLEEEHPNVGSSDNEANEHAMEDPHASDEDEGSPDILDLDKGDQDYVVMHDEEASDVEEGPVVRVTSKTPLTEARNTRSKGKAKQVMSPTPSPRASPPLVWEPFSSLTTDGPPTPATSDYFHKQILGLINAMVDAGQPVPMDEYNKLLVARQQSRPFRGRLVEQATPSSSPGLFHPTSTPAPSGSSRVSFASPTCGQPGAPATKESQPTSSPSQGDSKKGPSKE
ncbi:hypothetical protein DENSPDRAFT_886999 [Dentipellis sp. KUC8613]|nr:hypothetical protein DENSPDRAFT_886999 [Dentipellis sp. KUC8613]